MCLELLMDLLNYYTKLGALCPSLHRRTEIHHVLRVQARVADFGHRLDHGLLGRESAYEGSTELER